MGFEFCDWRKINLNKKMVWLLPSVWLIRLYGQMASKKSREVYQLDETLSNEIIIGGNPLIIVGEKEFEPQSV
jgi:hypothetical protein